ncbi:(S)-2-haloacid dehalogenase 2 [Fusarium oxysporum f. sp. albedinis]|nr:(S)-2-haloacid dehalogenase 2 [Fusarium oxysporum f. sp. albedinis]
MKVKLQFSPPLSTYLPYGKRPTYHILYVRVCEVRTKVNLPPSITRGYLPRFSAEAHVFDWFQTRFSETMGLRNIITDNMGLSLIFRGLVQPSDRMGELLMTLFDQARHFKVLDFRDDVFISYSRRGNALENDSHSP